LITAVVSDARPSCAVAISIASAELAPAAASRRNLATKWMVSSSTIPSATLATITVAMFSEMPSHPISPSTAATGSALAMMPRMPKRTDRNTAKITAKTVRKAVPKLLNCDITR
jgi:hypothetical protein